MEKPTVQLTGKELKAEIEWLEKHQFEKTNSTTNRPGWQRVRNHGSSEASFAKSRLFTRASREVSRRVNVSRL